MVLSGGNGFLDEMWTPKFSKNAHSAPTELEESISTAMIKNIFSVVRSKLLRYNLNKDEFDVNLVHKFPTNSS